MSETPLNNDQIIDFLGQLGLKNEFDYEILDIKLDENFGAIQYKHRQGKSPFFQIIHECRSGVSKKQGVITEIKIQPNHYSLLVHYNKKIYYFDPSYNEDNLYVCEEIKKRFKNIKKQPEDASFTDEDIHVMTTKLQIDGYTCGTYVCEFIRQIWNKYHEVQNRTINESDFETYLLKEVKSEGNFVFLAQSGRIFEDKYKDKIEEYSKLFEKVKKEQVKLEELKEEISKKLSMESVEYQCIKRCNNNNDIIITKCISDKNDNIISKTIASLDKESKKTQQYTKERLISMETTLQNLKTIQESITVYNNLLIQIEDDKNQLNSNKILLQQLANICSALQQNYRSESKENILQSLKKIQIEPQQQVDHESQPQTIQTIHNKLLKGFTIKK